MTSPAPAPTPLTNARDLAAEFLRCRQLSEALVAPLSDADATVQVMEDASPAKWHIAHVTWFFETFVLRDHYPGYEAFDPRFGYLFNSYYDAEGDRHPRPRRGVLTRPTLQEVLDWRRRVDAALMEALPVLPPAATGLIRLGIAHEQQHQELLLTDILALFAESPLLPAMWENEPIAWPDQGQAVAPIKWIDGREGIAAIGLDEDPATFSFDCERPRHRVLLHPHQIASRPVSNGDWLEFVADAGYGQPTLWLSDGWAWRNRNEINAPLYWRGEDGAWAQFGLDGLRPLDPTAPVTHISYYEADAFARWAGARLPTEAEWECAARDLDPESGNQLDGAGPVRPRPGPSSGGLQQMFGDVWEWTQSAYLPHPGFQPDPGATGEYNGKFMANQQVLKGGSCATPRGHVRASYRNFFYPHQRWQFTGLRLARDC